MKTYILLAIVAVLVVAVFALMGMWVQIGDRATQRLPPR